jgi:phenylalanyl-tRNA synthetase beta chain
MKASLNWLRSLVPALPDSAADVAERFTRGGLEVEAVEHFGKGLEQVLVAAVREIASHPSRSNLRLVTVDLGQGRCSTVVCGAPNVPSPGGLVCLAQVGATLPAIGLTLTPREIGGVRSEGMLLSEVEMGIGHDGSGIVILAPGAAAPGTSLTSALPAVHDVIFEIGVTPNRPDALGHIGLARDAATLFGLDFTPPRPDSPVRIAKGTIDERVAVEVLDFERCPHYGALVVEDAVIEPSPLWLRYRLHSLGVRSVSNIVDITNLVMLEYGHPMHAFDLDLVRGHRIVVRRAADGETMKTLDGVERTLVADDLLICDGEGPVALGGVMGGENTEIRSTTRRVLFECAFFHARGIRRTSRRHAIHTESSHRFERGVDPGDVADVLAHAGSLATHLAGAAAVPGAIHARRDPIVTPHVELRHKRLEALLGTEVPLGEAHTILTRLGFDITNIHHGDDHALLAVVPTWRPDVSREADLIEEVARVRGLDTIPTTLPPIRPQTPRDTLVLEGHVRAAAVALGLSEAVTYGFVSPASLERLGAPPAAVKLLNPLTDERSVMRTSLLPGLLETVARARRHGERAARLFTLGALFLPGPHDSLLPDECPAFAAILSGNRDAYLGRPQDVDVFDAKGIASEVAERVTGRSDIRAAAYEREAMPKALHPRAAGRLLAGDTEIGRFGVIHPDLAEAWDIAPATAVVELDLRALGAARSGTSKYMPIPRLPAASRDIALIVHEDTPAGEVASVIRQTAGELCESVDIFDVFTGKEIPADHRSLAFHVVYRDPKAATDPDHARTLTDEEVDRRHAEVVKTARERFGARLR